MTVCPYSSRRAACLNSFVVDEVQPKFYPLMTGRLIVGRDAPAQGKQSGINNFRVVNLDGRIEGAAWDCLCSSLWVFAFCGLRFGDSSFFRVAIFQGYGIRLSGVWDFCIFLPFWRQEQTPHTRRHNASPRGAFASNRSWESCWNRRHIAVSRTPEKYIYFFSWGDN